MRVYGWLAFHPKTGEQVRCIMAGSTREIQDTCRMLNIWPGRDYINRTGNESEIRQAEAKPGRVLWGPLNAGPEVVYRDWGVPSGTRRPAS